MDKHKNKDRRLLKLEKLEQHIQRACKYIASKRRERAERSYQRQMMQLLT